MPFGAIGGAVIGGVASAAVGAGINALTSKSQSGAISDGQSQANAVLAPYSTTGVQSNKQTADLLGLNGQSAADTAMSSFQASPGYAYQVSEGLKGVDAGAAAKGMLRSGATIKAEETLGSNLANQDFGNYISRLNSLSNYGITAAGGQASTDTSAAGQQASIYGNEGSGIGKAATGLLSNPDVQNSLFGSGTNQPSGGTGSGGNLDPYTGLSYMNA